MAARSAGLRCTPGNRVSAVAGSAPARSSSSATASVGPRSSIPATLRASAWRSSSSRPCSRVSSARSACRAAETAPACAVAASSRSSRVASARQRRRGDAEVRADGLPPALVEPVDAVVEVGDVVAERDHGTACHQRGPGQVGALPVHGERGRGDRCQQQPVDVGLGRRVRGAQPATEGVDAAGAPGQVVATGLDRVGRARVAARTGHRRHHRRRACHLLPRSPSRPAPPTGSGEPGHATAPEGHRRCGRTSARAGSAARAARRRWRRS